MLGRHGERTSFHNQTPVGERGTSPKDERLNFVSTATVVSVDDLWKNFDDDDREAILASLQIASRALIISANGVKRTADLKQQENGDSEYVQYLRDEYDEKKQLFLKMRDMEETLSYYMDVPFRPTNWPTA